MTTATQLHVLFQSENLAALIQNARTLLSNPIILTDFNHNVLEMSDEPDIEDARWRFIKKEGRIDTTKNISDVYRRSLLLHKPLLNRDVSDTINVMRMAVAHNEQLLGFLEIPCFYCIPNQEEQELIKFIADIACLLMKRDLGYLNTPSDDKYFFISDLIEGRISDENTCKARCKALQWDISGYYRFLTIGTKCDTAGNRKSILTRHKKSFEKAFSGTPVFLYGDLLKAIIPVKEDAVSDGKFFADLLDYLNANNLEAGISSSSENLLEIRTNHLASEKALFYGQLLKSDETLFFYDKYSVYHILETCDEHADVMQYCHSAIIKLANYDRTHNTELLDTMRTFLYTRQNIADSATKLYIHRNTMNNRLQKIDDLIHIDLQDSENIFHLMLSFHILEYVGANKIYDYETRILQNPLLKHQ